MCARACSCWPGRHCAGPDPWPPCAPPLPPQMYYDMAEALLTHPCPMPPQVYYDMAQAKYFRIAADFVVVCSGLYSQPSVPSYQVGGGGGGQPSVPSYQVGWSYLVSHV